MKTRLAEVVSARAATPRVGLTVWAVCDSSAAVTPAFARGHTATAASSTSALMRSRRCVREDIGEQLMHPVCLCRRYLASRDLREKACARRARTRAECLTAATHEAEWPLAHDRRIMLERPRRVLAAVCGAVRRSPTCKRRHGRTLDGAAAAGTVRDSMRTAPEADELDLPPLDGTGVGDDAADDTHGADGHADDDIELRHELGDALDDATSENDPLDELAVEGTEGGWLVDADDAKSLDVGVFDLSLSDEGKLLDADEPEVREPDEDLGGEEIVHADGGEEGPLAEDEELREEDLPALDADDDGDVAEESLFERGTIEAGEELRWDDRAWARAPVPGQDSHDSHDSHSDEPDDSGMLPVPGEDTKHGARDATWRRLEETGRITAAAIVPGESVVVVLDGPERPVLVRIQLDGAARIIAEIDNSTTDDDVEACRVTGLRWDAARRCLVATGTFGAQAFRPV